MNHLDNEYGIPPGAYEHHEDESILDSPEPSEEDEAIRLEVEQTRYDAALHLHEPLSGIEVFRGFFSYTDYQHLELEGTEIGTRYTNESWETRLEIVHSPYGKFHGGRGLPGRRLPPR